MKAVIPSRSPSSSKNSVCESSKRIICTSRQPSKLKIGARPMPSAISTARKSVVSGSKRYATFFMSQPFSVVVNVMPQQKASVARVSSGVISPRRVVTSLCSIWQDWKNRLFVWGLSTPWNVRANALRLRLECACGIYSRADCVFWRSRTMIPKRSGPSFDFIPTRSRTVLV